MKTPLGLTFGLIGLPLMAAAQPLPLSDMQMDVVVGAFAVYHGLTDAERAALLPFIMQVVAPAGTGSTTQPGYGVQSQIVFPTFQIDAINVSLHW